MQLEDSVVSVSGDLKRQRSKLQGGWNQHVGANLTSAIELQVQLKASLEDAEEFGHSDQGSVRRGRQQERVRSSPANRISDS